MITHYETVITPKRRLFHVNLREIFHYRDLLWLLVRRNYVLRYKQTALGFLWLVLQPLLTTLVFTFVFVFVMKVPTDEKPPILFYLCSMLPWHYFSQSAMGAGKSLLENAPLFKKVYFPRLIAPLAAVLSQALTYVVELVTVTAFYFWFKWSGSLGAGTMNLGSILLLPLLFLQTMALSLGTGLWIAAFTVKRRDLHYALVTILLLWMYGTPIVYPVSMIPAQWQSLLVLNPMAPIVEMHRQVFLGGSALGFQGLWISAGIVVVIFVTGVLAFNRAEANFLDTI